MKCNQAGCEKLAAFLYTWPGKDQAGICEEHAPKARGIAEAMGLYLQMIPVTVVDRDGNQVKEGS